MSVFEVGKTYKTTYGDIRNVLGKLPDGHLIVECKSVGGQPMAYIYAADGTSSSSNIHPGDLIPPRPPVVVSDAMIAQVRNLLEGWLGRPAPHYPGLREAIHEVVRLYLEEQGAK